MRGLTVVLVNTKHCVTSPQPTVYFCSYCVRARVCVHVCACICVNAGEAAAASVPVELPRLSWVPPQEVPLWDISHCHLEDGQILISPEDEVSIPPVHTTGSQVAERLGNLTSNQKVAGLIPGCAK